MTLSILSDFICWLSGIHSIHYVPFCLSFVCGLSSLAVHANIASIMTLLLVQSSCLIFASFLTLVFLDLFL